MIAPAVWHDLLQRIGRQLARNRDGDRIDGLRVIALDGVELFVNHSVTCRDCLHRTVNGVTEWFHRIVVASTVGPHRQTVLEWDVIHPADGSDKNEGEPTAAYRPLTTLYHTYHHHIQGHRGGCAVRDACLYSGRATARLGCRHSPER